MAAGSDRVDEAVFGRRSSAVSEQPRDASLSALRSGAAAGVPEHAFRTRQPVAPGEVVTPAHSTVAFVDAGPRGRVTAVAGGRPVPGTTNPFFGNFLGRYVPGPRGSCTLRGDAACRAGLEVPVIPASDRADEPMIDAGHTKAFTAVDSPRRCPSRSVVRIGHTEDRLCSRRLSW